MKDVVTITISPLIDKKIRKLQSQLIQETMTTWSYSRVVELLVKQGLKTLPALEKL